MRPKYHTLKWLGLYCAGSTGSTSGASPYHRTVYCLSVGGELRQILLSAKYSTTFDGVPRGICADSTRSSKWCSAVSPDWATLPIRFWRDALSIQIVLKIASTCRAVVYDWPEVILKGLFLHSWSGPCSTYVDQVRLPFTCVQRGHWQRFNHLRCTVVQLG